MRAEGSLHLGSGMYFVASFQGYPSVHFACYFESEDEASSTADFLLVQ